MEYKDLQKDNVKLIKKRKVFKVVILSILILILYVLGIFTGLGTKSVIEWNNNNSNTENVELDIYYDYYSLNRMNDNIMPYVNSTTPNGSVSNGYFNTYFMSLKECQINGTFPLSNITSLVNQHLVYFSVNPYFQSSLFFTYGSTSDIDYELQLIVDIGTDGSVDNPQYFVAWVIGYTYDGTNLKVVKNDNNVGGIQVSYWSSMSGGAVNAQGYGFLTSFFNTYDNSNTTENVFMTLYQFITYRQSVYNSGYNYFVNDIYIRSLLDNSILGNDGIYQAGFNDGIVKGQDNVMNSPNDFGLYTKQQYDQNYSNGVNSVEPDLASNGFFIMMASILNAPYNILHGMFNFEIFGINLFTLISFIFTGMLVFFIIKIFFVK